MGVAWQRGSDLNFEVNCAAAATCECVNYQMSPFSRKYDEKKIFMLNSGSSTKLSSRLTTS